MFIPFLISHPQVRAAATPKTPKSVQFNEDITVATGAGEEPLRLSSAHINTPRTERAPLGPIRGNSAPNVYASLDGGLPSISNKVFTSNVQPGTTFLDELPTALEKSRLRPIGGTLNAHHASKSSNFQPSNLRHSWAAESSYKSQFPHADLGYKNDSQFDWDADSGRPRPWFNLLKMQDAFSKSEVRKKFHRQFPETNPDLRENLVTGKKHEFYGMNAQVLRGTTVDA